MFVIAEEVREALREGRPVVALESSVVAQGLPPPHGLEAAARCEAAIRAEGGVPATVAVLGGRVVVGATARQLAVLAEPGVAKAGARDLGPLVAAGRDAGTTVSATVVAAAHAGIRVFATGGIGGVHRGARRAEQTWDVSADLPALGAHPVAVVSAGAKAILDLPATLEVLETLGVPVIGLGVDELPAFYTNHSGLVLEHVARDPAEAAAILAAHFRMGGHGVLLANPVPSSHSLPPETVASFLDEALREAEARDVRGKALTPFLLGRIAAIEGLGAVETNVAVLVSNASAAARVAVELAAREHGSVGGGR